VSAATAIRTPPPRRTGPAPRAFDERAIVRLRPVAGELRQVFAVPADGVPGRCWVSLPDALAAGGFGRGWVARRLDAERARIGPAALAAALRSPDGLRLRPPVA
jgi:hypothetical protein